MFQSSELSTDTLPNKLILQQPINGFRSGSDALLLVDYFLKNHTVTLKNNAILDIGCGSGAVSLSILKENKIASVTGLDVQPDYCQLAVNNASLNEIDTRFSVKHGDIQTIHQIFPINTFDYVLSNPPFYNITGGRVPNDIGKKIAHHGTVDLTDWIRKSLYPLKNKGFLMMICRTDRLGDIYAALDKRAGNIHIQPIFTGKTHYAKRIIISCQKSSKGGTKISL
jgi:tRNA1Val (adenine37-N6)-methyltransferase